MPLYPSEFLAEAAIIKDVLAREKQRSWVTSIYVHKGEPREKWVTPWGGLEFQFREYCQQRMINFWRNDKEKQF